MNLSNALNMDPHLLVGLLNTELRDFSEDLEDLVKTHDLDRDQLIAKMEAAGYIYQAGQKQFR
jgi:hypothetical protein